MTAGVYTVTIEQGATFRLRLTLRLPATVVGEPGELYDLTDHIARMQIRHRTASPEILYALTTENGGITLGGAAGTIDLYISDEDTASFAFRSAVYDLEIETVPDGDVTRIIQGPVNLSPEVTR
jgi:hypothetical protein